MEEVYMQNDAQEHACECMKNHLNLKDWIKFV